MYPTCLQRGKFFPLPQSCAFIAALAEEQLLFCSFIIENSLTLLCSGAAVVTLTHGRAIFRKMLGSPPEQCNSLVSEMNSPSKSQTLSD